MEQQFGHGLTAQQAERRILYTPEVRPGFVAWTTCFTYGDGRIGLSRQRILQPSIVSIHARHC